MTTLLAKTRLFATAAALLATAAQAESPFTHPALRDGTPAAAGWAQARAAAPLIIGHPASPRWTTVHANGAHPAVLVHARAATPIDPNTFIVQPPATASWTPPQADGVALAATATATPR